MARMPGVTWVGEKSPKRRMSRRDIACIHTIVGTAPAHAAHFSTSGAGRIYQSRDTRYRSAANLDGNYRIIAIENADHGPEFPIWNVKDGHAVPAFTNAQMDAIARILAWCHTTHGIPLVLVPDSKPGRRGIAYHRQGIDGNWSGYRYGGRVPGGEVWTEARGKVCPGDRRIAQIPDIIRRAKALLSPKDWFDMATEADLERVVERSLNRRWILGTSWDDWKGGIENIVWRMTAGKIHTWENLRGGIEGVVRRETPGIVSRTVEALLTKRRGEYRTGLPVSIAHPGAHRYAHWGLEKASSVEVGMRKMAELLLDADQLKEWEATVASAEVEQPEDDA